MKAMPLPFDHFQGQGFFDLSSSPSPSPSSSFSDPLFLLNCIPKQEEKICTDFCYVGEPTSVLDAIRSPSPLTSSSTTALSSSHGSGGAPTDAVAAAAVEKCVGLVEDWENVLPPPGSPGQEQSILKLIMGDVEDPVMDPGSGFGSITDNAFASNDAGLQFQNPVVPFFPLSFAQPQQEHCPLPPPAKRVNSGQIGFQQDPIIEQLLKAAEVMGTGGDPVLAQAILARLNHQLNPAVITKPPFQRAAFYLKEALLSLLHQPTPSPSSQNLIFNIAAYKSSSETLPFLQFTNFTSNQTILESLNGCDRIHVIDFDIGFGLQWASLMQELVLKNGTPSPPPLKLTAFASPLAPIDELELRFTVENLKQFARELNIPFEIEILSLDLLLHNSFYQPLSIRSSQNEAIAVNLPVSSIIPGYLPLVLRFLKQNSPNVVVSIDRTCDRTDAPFPHHVIHLLHYNSTLLESCDASNLNSDVVSKIERFWIQREIERAVMNRGRWMERTLPWRTLFTQCGFKPSKMSNFAEAQGEYVVQRTAARGFHVEKRQQQSLVLSWQRKELVAVSSWQCC